MIEERIDFKSEILIAENIKKIENLKYKIFELPDYEKQNRNLKIMEESVKKFFA